MEYGTQNRNIQYDLLRILAAFSVVMLHSAAQYWYDLPIDGRAWKTVNAYDACFRFGVPIFVMISGAIFLDPKRELDVKRLYRHNMLRLAVIYLLHIGVMELLEARGIHSAMMPVAVGVPLLALLVFALCYGISALLRRIPWVGRYLC